MKAVSSRSSGLSRGAFFFGLCAVFLTLCISVEAQQPKMARIGYLSPRCGPPPTVVAFKEGLRELGWVEGKQMEFEFRFSCGDLDKLAEFATELVRLKADVIVAGPAGAAPAAKRATTTIPIVMVAVIDPVSQGLIASLARPGANVTGLTFEVTRGAGRKKPGAS